jgi:tetratricopeptide (TPR) repeat protein
MIARSLRVKAEVLAGEDRYQEAIESLDDLVERFDGVGEPEIRRQVASALCNRVLVLEGMGNQEEALTAHSDMVSRFGEEILSVLDEQVRLCAGSELLRVREQLAATLLSQARVLVQLGRAEQAQSSLLMLIGQFEDDADPRSQSAVTSAREMLDEMIQSE